MTWDGTERRHNDYRSSEKSDKYLDVLLEVKESVSIIKTRQEEQVKRQEIVEKVAYEAKDIATQALLQSKDNEKDLELFKAEQERLTESQKEGRRWMWGIAITVILGILTAVATIVAAHI